MVCVQLKNCCWKIFVSARIKLQWALGCRCNKWCVGIRNLQIESMCPAPKQLPNKNCVKAALANRCYVMLRLGFCQTIFLDGVCCPTKPMMNKKQKMKKCTNDEQRLSSWWGSKLRLQVDGRLVGACIQRLRLGDGLVFNERLAWTSADWKTKAEDKYKKLIFIRLLEPKLIANYSRLLFLQPAYCQTFCWAIFS